MTTRLSTGLRNAMLTNNSYPRVLITGIVHSFVDGGAGNDQIHRSAGSYVTDGFRVGDYISVTGSTSNNVTGVKVLAVAAADLDVATATLTTEAAGDQVVIGTGGNGGSLDELLRDGVIDVYTGSQPATADLTESGTKLLRITKSSGAFTPGTETNGLNLATAAAGVSSKESGETWSGVGLAAGTAGWFRYYDNNATTGASSTAVRFDGVCGVGSGELRMSSLTVAVGATTTVDSGSITQPASA